MVHVIGLLGCMANAPDTEAALAATPEAIRAYRRFLRRQGEVIDAEEPFTTRIIHHVTEGEGLGEGMPYVTFAPDLVPLSAPEVDLYLNRLHGLSDKLATWAAARSPAELDALPTERGRTARAILLHVIGAQGAALSYALTGAPGFGRLRGAAERGELDLTVAVRQAADLAASYTRGASPAQREQIRELNGNQYTLRKSVRHLLEHGWEHLVELARRPGGPQL